jgi:hypothetical protein
MQTILANKLEVNPGAGPELPVTALSFLRLMFSVSRAASAQLGLVDALPASLPDQLLHQVNIFTIRHYLLTCQTDFQTCSIVPFFFLLILLKMTTNEICNFLNICFGSC